MEGAYGMKTEYAETKGGPPINFTVKERIGTTIYRDYGFRPVDKRFLHTVDHRGGLNVGDKIFVVGLLGELRPMTVEKVGISSCAESEDMIASLEFSPATADDPAEWICTLLCNKKALSRVDFK